ncbi:MAG TPA: protein kinase [Gemmatimonadales bacterium]|nr:protein kinase [Gemmatimonadales bacterium]
MDSPHSSIPPGLVTALADRYRIERELGAGGMATVYLAQDLRHHRQVAIKVLRPDLAAALGPDRFVQEIEIAARLQHPHILGLIDSGVAEVEGSRGRGVERSTASTASTASTPSSLLYYVMPYVEGESLRERLSRQGELPVHEAVRVLSEVADALGYAHSRGVVHRDIKPENVMLSGRHALVMDFGVAKAVNDASGKNRLTTLGVALGTPTYMAPEQASADPHLDHRVDIYALGVMGYELLAGRPPFTGASPQQVLAAHVMQQPEPLTSHRPTLSAGLTSVIMKALEKRPADRWQSAEEMLAQLEPLATPSGGTTPTATAPFVAVGTSRQAARGMPRWAMAAIGVAVVAAGVFAWSRVARGRPDGAGSAGQVQSLAVLPFENIGGDSSNAAFADGMQSEILTDLTRLGALQVTSRNSVQEYRNTSKPTRQIGAELGVQSLLQGQVQQAGNQVRVTVQLVDAPTDRQIWAESYDRELTAQNIFSIQADIANNVAQALRTSFTSSDVAAAQAAPTDNLEALDWYHRGQELFANRSGSIVDNGMVAAFGRAVGLDSTFAEAWAGLASARSWQVRNGTTTDTMPARSALDHAMALAPSAIETKIAQAYFAYYSRGDYDGALALFKAVAAERPSDADAVAGVGYIARRRGRYEEALAAERKLIELDPRNAGALSDIGYTYLMLRRYADAEEVLKRSLIIDPSGGGALGWQLQAIVFGRGDTAAGREFVTSLPDAVAPEERAFLTATMARLARQFDSSSAALDHGPNVRPLDRPELLIRKAFNDIASGAPARARARADTAASLARAFLGRISGTGVFGLVGDFQSILGIAEAIRGRSAEAVQAGERAIVLNPESRDASEGSRSYDALLIIHLLLGHRDQAVRLVMARSHSPISSSTILLITQQSIRLEPLFDGIRDDPRIQALLKNDAAWVVQ